MTKIGLVVKDDEKARKLAVKVREFLISRGIDASLDMEEEGECHIEKMRVNMFLVLGGDGTILKTVAKARDKDAPILGINFGTTGFLAQVQPKEWKDALERIVSGDYWLEERAKLEVTAGKNTDNALNEVALVSATPVEILHLELKVDGDRVQTIKADGVIVSTPTGSTAYTRSCGGPVVDPRVKCFVVTSICPFEGGIKSLVVPQSSLIEVRLKGKGSALVVVDGEKKLPLALGESAFFRLSEEKVRFIKLMDDFYSKLRERR
jgi:NAD+ kinase